MEGDSEAGSRIWMKKNDGEKAMEFRMLDDAVLVLRRVFSCEEEANGNGLLLVD